MNLIGEHGEDLMRNSRNAYNFGCETRQKMNERCNELSSLLDSAHAKIDSLTAELKEESSKHRTTLNKVLSVFQKVVPDAMDQVGCCTTESTKPCMSMSRL